MTKAAPKSWIDMAAVRVSKPRPVSRIWKTESASEQRRQMLKWVTAHHNADPLKEGARRFGAVDCIYFVRMGSTDAYKIGYTHHLRQRVSALGAGIPVPVFPVSWVSFFDDNWLGEAEFRAHELAGLYGDRLKGEWFNLKEDHIRKIVDNLVEGLRDEVMGVSYDGEVPR